MGEWLNTNAEALYGAGRTPLGAELAASSITDSRFVYRKPIGWRCTTKAGRLYIHLFEWPSGPFRLAGLRGKITHADLLADPEHEPLGVSQHDGDATILLPLKPPGGLANVIRLAYEVSPV